MLMTNLLKAHSHTSQQTFITHKNYQKTKNTNKKKMEQQQPVQGTPTQRQTLSCENLFEAMLDKRQKNFTSLALKTIKRFYTLF